MTRPPLADTVFHQCAAPPSSSSQAFLSFSKRSSPYRHSCTYAPPTCHHDPSEPRVWQLLYYPPNPAPLWVERIVDGRHGVKELMIFFGFHEVVGWAVARFGSLRTAVQLWRGQRSEASDVILLDCNSDKTLLE